jgi:hypothetical protein
MFPAPAHKGAFVIGGIWNSFVRSLGAEKAPYVITIFVAVLGWTALRTSDRLQQIAFVEYQTESAPSASGRGKDAVIRLRNVTTAQSFSCFILEQLTPAKFGDGADQRIRYRGTVAAKTTLLKAAEANWQWEVRDFSPGADLELGAPLQEGAKWNVLVRPCDPSPIVAAKKDADKKEAAADKPSAPVFIEKSMVTWYVEHELTVLWAGLVLWLALLIYLNSRRSAAQQAAAAAGAPAAAVPAAAPSGAAAPVAATSATTPAASAASAAAPSAPSAP